MVSQDNRKQNRMCHIPSQGDSATNDFKSPIDRRLKIACLTYTLDACITYWHSIFV